MLSDPRRTADTDMPTLGALPPGRSCGRHANRGCAAGCRRTTPRHDCERCRARRLRTCLMARDCAGIARSALPERVARGTAHAPRSPSKFGDHFFERREALRVDQLQQAQLEVQARIGLAAQIVVGGEQNIEKAREILFAELRGLFGEPRALVGGRGDQIRIRAANARHQQIAKMANGFAAEVLQILPVGDQPVHQGQARARPTASAIASTSSSSTLSATTPSSSRTCVSVIASPQ